MSLTEAYKVIAGAAEHCTECGACVRRCEVLEQAPVLEGACDTGALLGPTEGEEPESDGAGCSVGTLARLFACAFRGADAEALAAHPDCGAQALAAVARIAEQHADALFAVRRCCMCGHCTVACAEGVDARETFSALRELLALSGAITGEGFESTQVDLEWHIFSVYRAVHGIYFQDLPGCDDALEHGADTLFFPGCPLASYAPDLAREVFQWLLDQGVNAVFSDACCGSPLKSAGRMERAEAFKRSLAESFWAAGIRRIVCVCPGCADELASAAGIGDIEIVPLPRLLAEAGMKARPDKLRAFMQDGDGVRESAAVEGAVPAVALAERPASAERPVDSLALTPVPTPAALSASAEVTLPAPSERALFPRIAVFDSCHDRDQAFGRHLRALFEKETLVELPHRGKNALCCGAAGSVSLVDPGICERRAHRIMEDETAAASADLLVANCPTCTYTFAAQHRADAAAGRAGTCAPQANYLELVFETSFDWDTVFPRLESMWTGEYGAWVCQQLL